MRSPITWLAAVLGLCASSALAAPAPQNPPALRGTYVYAWEHTCDSSGIPIRVAALAHFHPHKHQVTITGYRAGAGGGVIGINQTVSYSNTATTIVIDGKTYNVVYGLLAGRVATYLSYVSSTSHCVEQATLSRRTK